MRNLRETSSPVLSGARLRVGIEGAILDDGDRAATRDTKAAVAVKATGGVGWPEVISQSHFIVERADLTNRCFREGAYSIWRPDIWRLDGSRVRPAATE